AGHIPGAVWVDHDAWARAFAAGQDPQQWAERIGKLGITAGKPVVVYDDDLAREAARIWWILRYWGVNDARLLNGGSKEWVAGGHAVSKEEPAVAAAHFVAPAQGRRLATQGQVLQGLKKDQFQIVDARSETEHCAGAIPGAVNLEWSDALDPKTQRFKSAAEL